MTRHINYWEYPVLFVDKDNESLIAYRKRFGNTFSMLFANSPMEAFDILECNPHIAVVVSDQNIPRISGTEFLCGIRERYPDVIRIILTAESDFNVAVDAINRGNIYKYLIKPCKYDLLKIELMRAIEQYVLAMERRILIEERISLERLSIIGGLADGFAHEIRNPVAVIILNAEVSLSRILERPFPAEELIHSLKEILTQCNRLSDAIDQIMEFARPNKADYEYIRLSDLMERAIFLIREEIHFDQIDVITDVPDDLPELYGAKIQLEQVLINLLRNSHRSMKGEGIVCLKGRVSPNQADIVIEIKDNGAGISKEDFRHILRQFFSNKQDVSGIGLYICSKIIESLGGEMLCDISADGGNLIRITLPIRKRPFLLIPGSFDQEKERCVSSREKG